MALAASAAAQISCTGLALLSTRSRLRPRPRRAYFDKGDMQKLTRVMHSMEVNEPREVEIDPETSTIRRAMYNHIVVPARKATLFNKWHQFQMLCLAIVLTIPSLTLSFQEKKDLWEVCRLLSSFFSLANINVLIVNRYCRHFRYSVVSPCVYRCYVYAVASYFFSNFIV